LCGRTKVRVWRPWCTVWHSADRAAPPQLRPSGPGNNCVRRVRSDGIVVRVAGRQSRACRKWVAVGREAQLGGLPASAPTMHVRAAARPPVQELARREATATVRSHVADRLIRLTRPSITSVFLAGGMATSAQLRSPLGVAPDGLGGIFIADCEGACAVSLLCSSQGPHLPTSSLLQQTTTPYVMYPLRG